MNIKIDRPIFIVGCGRSGTTIFYRLFAGNRDLGWISGYLERFPRLCFLSLLNPCFKLPLLTSRFHSVKGFPKPVEGHKIWDLFHPVSESLGGPPLTAGDAAQADLPGMLNYFQKILRYSRGMRFVNKNTRNSRRLPYLLTLFPDAYIIHVIRDGRAVANSFLANESWWPTLPIWWAEGKTLVQLQAEGMVPELVAAGMWKHEVEQVMKDKEVIPDNQYLEIRYEELMQRPARTMRTACDFCKIPWDDRMASHVDAFGVHNRNFKWTEKLSKKQIALIESEIAPLMRRLNYSL